MPHTFHLKVMKGESYIIQKQHSLICKISALHIVDRRQEIVAKEEADVQGGGLPIIKGQAQSPY